MGVVVDKSGGDDAPLGVDRTFGGGAGIFANSDDLAVLDRNIRGKGRLARAVDHAPVFYEQIIRHAGSSSLPPRQPANMAAWSEGTPASSAEVTLRFEGE